MSRRTSRVSVDTRQNDTLLEFENFKKKFLLANKHITKLNSTLSVRIEELNAQISTLYVENLRLRASEIALATQLKKERERSRMIVVEAEAATHNLMKHLGHIRKSFNVPHGRSTTPEAKPLPELRTRRPPHDVNTSPLVPRLARPPTVPGILEEADEYADGGLDEDEPLSPTPIRRKSKSRPSGELPDRSVPLSLDLPIITFDDQLSQTGKRKPTRRQSGLLTSVSITTVTPKSYSDMLPPRPPSPAFGSPLRMEAALEEEEEALEVIQDARRRGEEEEDAEEPLALTITRRDKRKKSKEKEGTVNCGRELLSESSRRELDKRRSREAEDGAGPLTGKKPKLKDVTNAPPPRPSLANLENRDHSPDIELPSSTTSTSYSTGRTFLATPNPTPKPSLPTPRASSPIHPTTDVEPEDIGGVRERRVRKSINYAEPKLNTKMRKPDPTPSTSKRTSITSETIPRRSLDVQSSAPPSSSSTDSGSGSGSHQPPPVTGLKRKKSRVHVPAEDAEDSDGTQADAEYGGLRSGSSTGWVNVDGRRRSVHTNVGARRAEGDDLRRHSMAV